MAKRGEVFDLWLVYVRREDKGAWQPFWPGSIPEYRIFNSIPVSHCLWIAERRTGWIPQSERK